MTANSTEILSLDDLGGVTVDGQEVTEARINFEQLEDGLVTVPTE